MGVARAAQIACCFDQSWRSIAIAYKNIQKTHVNFEKPHVEKLNGVSVFTSNKKQLKNLYRE